jgi:hypothetical protein
VELIEETVDWEPKAATMTEPTLVEIQIDWSEVELREAVEAAGGRWNPDRKVWRLAHGEVVRLGLEQRIVARDP